MALKGDARHKMYLLPAAKKWQIIEQARAFHSTLDGKAPRPSQSTQSTLGASVGGAFLPRLVLQLAGDSGILKRFSMVTWGTSAAAPLVMSPNLAANLTKSMRRCNLQVERYVQFFLYF
ncbi:hypothetical protein BDR05DRAFT_364794 [Suillus weaverae]|nr:hypothetical protein BDR05DRAFT_364794 [Suillus weaverae]